jgi:hypothetical protein
MREERHPGDLREEGRSSARPVLIAAGVVLGIALVVCGGVAGHVAWTDAHRVVEEPKDRETIPERADESLRKIVKINLPVGLTPLSSEHRGRVRRVVCGKRVAEGFALQLAKIDFSIAPQGVDREASLPMLKQMLEMENREPGANRFVPDPEPAETTRVLTVLGKEVPFNFSKGKLTVTGEAGWGVSGTFTTETGLVAFKCIVPESEYDEQAMIRMIESIDPGEDDAPADSRPG